MFRVLFVDDEQIVREGIQHLIDWEEEGFTICGQAGDGNEALRKIKETKPHLVMIDVKMPGMTGLDVIRRAREFDFQGEFIILTGFSDFEFAKQAITLKVPQYLLKPIDEDELLDIVRQMHRELESKEISREKQEKHLEYLQDYMESGRETKKMADYILAANQKGVQEEYDKFVQFMEKKNLDIIQTKECIIIYFNQLKAQLSNLLKQDVIEQVKPKKNKEELYQWLNDYLLDTVRKNKEDEGRNIVQRVLDYMESHYEENIKMETIANLFHYNNAYLGKVIRREKGDSFNNILDQIRIRKAMELLKNTDDKIYQISEQVGFRNIDYFYTKFKKYAGISAKEYRKQNREAGKE